MELPLESLGDFLYNRMRLKKGVIEIISKEIKKVLLEKDMQVKDLAVLLKCTPENLYKKFKKDDWKESDIQEIAYALNCEYIQELKMR